jgi:group II intron reverse transcriptase/maturase
MWTTVNLEVEAAAKDPTNKTLMQQVTAPENILIALQTVILKRASSLSENDQQTLSILRHMGFDKQVRLLQKKITNFQVHPLQSSNIRKKDGSYRLVVNLSFLDRIVQQCMKQVMEPICERQFDAHSYAYRPGLSCKKAIRDCVTHINATQDVYVVDIDIRHFFDEINHEKLMMQLCQMGIQDKDLLLLIKKFITSPIRLSNGKIIHPKKGLPQGGIISPLLANVVLNEFDQWVSQQDVPMYSVRYADDFKVFTDSWAHAHEAFELIRSWLSEKLFLQINEDKSKITNLKKQGSDFLGFTLHVQKKEESEEYFGSVRVSTENRKRIQGVLTWKIESYLKRPSQKNLKSYKYSLRGAYNYYGEYLDAAFQKKIKRFNQIMPK